MKKLVLLSLIERHKYCNTGVEYIAAFLRKHNIEVVIKFYHDNQSYEEIIDSLPLTYDYYGFSVYSTNYARFKSVANYLREHTNSIIIFGGQFVSMNYTCIIKNDMPADFYVLGDGEEPMLRIINSQISKNNIFEFEDKNIATNYSYENKTNAINDDINRFPSYDYFEQDSLERNKEKVYTIFSKNNVCNGACTFCCSKKGRFFYKTPERIVQEISFLAQKYQVRDFHFGDDNIFDMDSSENYNRLMQLFNLILDNKLNLVFSGFAKSKSISTKNIELLRLMSKIGFYYLFIGVDAGCEFDRCLYNKSSSLQENITAIEMLNNVGIFPRYGVITINPYSSVSTLKENYKYLCKLHSSNYYHFGGLQLQVLYGTKMYEKVKMDGLLRDDYSYMNVYGYNFVNQDIVPTVHFLRDSFYPKMNQIICPFLKLKRIFEKTRHLSSSVLVFQERITEAEDLEHQILKEYFGHLYLAGDVKYCQTMLNSFFLEMDRRSLQYMELYTFLEDVYKQIPITK